MKIYGKILDVIVKVVSWILILFVAGIITMMLTELCARNFFSVSFRFSTELCGFLFMWMAFLGIIVLYHQDRLITLDILYAHVSERIQTVFWFVNKAFSICLGVTMVIAYKGMYPINSTSYFSTMQFLSKAWHFLPMALAGGFIVLESVYQIMERITNMNSKKIH